MATLAPTMRASDQQAQGATDRRSTGGKVPKPRQGALAGRATAVSPEAPEANQLPLIFSRFMPLTEGQGSSNKPGDSGLHVGNPMCKCCCHRLSPSKTKLEVLTI